MSRVRRFVIVVVAASALMSLGAGGFGAAQAGIQGSGKSSVAGIQGTGKTQVAGIQGSGGPR
jgi:hypothetical protein